VKLPGYWLPQLLLVLTMMLEGCASNGQSTDLLNVQTVFKSQYCASGKSSPDLTWLGEKAKWESYLQKLSDDPRVMFDSVVNENSKGILIVALGQKTSGGYGLALAPKAPFIENNNDSTHQSNTLVIPLTLIEPKSGGMRISVMTQPCMGLSVVSDVDIDHVKIESSPANVFESIRIQ